MPLTTQDIIARALGRAIRLADAHPPVELTDPQLLEMADLLAVALAGELALVPKEHWDRLTVLGRHLVPNRTLRASRLTTGQIAMSLGERNLLAHGYGASWAEAVSSVLDDFKRLSKGAEKP